jgi:hypothetical protein
MRILTDFRPALHQIGCLLLYGDQIKEDEMGGACSTEGENCLGGMDTDGKIILKDTSVSKI